MINTPLLCGGVFYWRGRRTDLPPDHSSYSVAAFHEALRILLAHGREQKAADYAFHEQALRQTVEAMGCEVTSNMTSLVVFN